MQHHIRKNLDSADRILKVVLAISVVACYLPGVISGPFATILMVMACITLVLAAVQFIHDRNITQ